MHARTLNAGLPGLLLALAATLCADGKLLSGDDAPIRRITVQVVDHDTRQGIAHAALRLFWNGHESDEVADDQGTFGFDWPAEGFLVVTASAPGHAGVRIGYHPERGGPPPQVPDTITAALPLAHTISGRVLDDQGQPVVGAKIEVSGNGPWEQGSPVSWQFRQEDVVTDADGRWSFDRAPPEMASLTLQIKHPDFEHTLERHASQPREGQAGSTLLPVLREGTGVTTLQRGIRVRGTITGPEDQPVPDAIISVPFDQYGPVQERARSNERGEWHVHLPPGKVLLSFEVPNLAPTRREVEVTPDIQPLEVQLTSGWVMRGRVVDPQGQPREGIRVGVDTIGGDRGRRFPVHWRGRTDSEGRFEWRNAPDEAFTISIYGSDKVMRLADVPISRSDDEIVFTMHQALRFRGKVTDAATGQPITKFTVIPGMGWGGGTIRLGRDSARVYESADGSYAYAVDFPRESHQLVFEADGYAPFQSGTYHNEDGAQTLDVAMQPAAPITGAVVRADGQPVGPTRVYVGTSMDPVSIEGGKSMPPPNEALFIEVNADGRFEIPQQVGAFALAAINDYGVALALDGDLQGDRPLVLQPWSRVLVEVLDRGAPVEGRRVSIDGMFDPHDPLRFIHFRNTGETDADGLCMFTHIPPGQWRATEWEPTGERSHRSDRFAIVDVKPGEERRVATRAGGVRVTGRSVVPEGLRIDGRLSMAHVFIHSQRQPTLPDNWADMTGEQRAKWREDWQKSDAGRRHARDAFLNDRYYFARLDDDGGFEIEGVAPGAYSLRIEALDPAQPGVAMLCRTIKEHDIVVPADQARVDLGEFELEAITRLRVGDEAPAFAITTVDGERLVLADFRGKYVFLDFWATWCGPCKAEMPHIKALHEAMKDRDDFALISLSLDNDVALPRNYARDNGMNWTQGFLGRWSDDTVTKAYGVQGIPATFLIGPDGRIVLTNPRGGEVVAAVRRAMEPGQPR